jgi:hypothetical protein
VVLRKVIATRAAAASIALRWNQPLVPLAVALPQLLAKIEAELANQKLNAADEERLCQRADLIRGLLAPGPIT